MLGAQLADGSLYDYMAKLRYGFAPQFSAQDADALVAGLASAGIRAVFCYGLSDVADAGKPIEAARAFNTTWRHGDAQRLRSSRFSSSDGLIRFGIGASEFLFAPLHYTVAEVDWPGSWTRTGFRSTSPTGLLPAGRVTSRTS